MSTPGFLTFLGFLGAGLFGFLATPLLFLAYWLGKRDWRRDFSEYKQESPDTVGTLIRRNLLRMLLFLIPLGGFIGGYMLMDVWYMHGARVAAAEAGRSHGSK